MTDGCVIVLGSINLDVQLSVEAFPRAGETVRSLSVTRGLGGKGANQAVAACRMGAPTRLCAAIGHDREVLDLLRRTAPDLDVSRVTVEPDCETGAAYILVSQEGENQIVIVGGANERLHGHGNFVPGPGDICLAQLEVPIPAIAHFFEAAKAVGARTVLNAAPAHDGGRTLLSLTDLLVVNETELAHFAGRPDLPDDDIEQLARAARGLRTRGDQTVIVTLGANGALIVDGEDRHVPAKPAIALDTTGAGDCFCGVLCAGLAESADIVTAAARANLAASLQVGRQGAAEAMPWRAEIEALSA